MERFFIFAKTQDMNKSNFRFLNLSLVLVFVISIVSCKNNFKVDLSDIEKCNVKIKRYEIDLFGQPLNDNSLNKLQKKYPLFLGNTPLTNEQKIQLENYVNDPFLQKLFDESQKKYPDLTKEESELSEAFEHIRYYFPSFKYPGVYSYISGSQEEAYYQDQTIIFSIDRYFGLNHEYYGMAGIPKYIQAQMRPEYISRDVINSIAKYYIAEPAPDESLLAHIIYHGKLIYFIKSMMPDISDEILFAQTDYHLNWLVDKRKNLWRYYIENELLFKSDYETYKKFIADAPFTSVLGDDSAARTGRWLGYQIVYSFMKNNKIPLSEMIRLSGDQQFLNRSEFKP